MDTFEKMMRIIGRQLATDDATGIAPRGLVNGSGRDGRASPQSQGGRPASSSDDGAQAEFPGSLDHVVVLGEN